MGRIEEAIEILGNAQSFAAVDAEPRIRLCLAHNHLDCLTKAGRFVEAEALSPDVKLLMQEAGSQIDRLRFRWAEARIAKGLGRTAEAIEALDAVRGEFASASLGYDAALCSLELAALCAEAGEAQRVLPLVEETLPILSALQVTREGLMAVSVLSQAVGKGNVTRELIRQVLEFFRRAETKAQS